MAKTLTSLCLFLVLYTVAYAEDELTNIYVFDIQLTTNGEIEGPLTVTLADGFPVRIITPGDHIILLTMKEVSLNSKFVTGIEADVLLNTSSGPELVKMPRMFVSGAGNVSLAPMGDQGGGVLEELKINIAEVIPATHEELKILMSLSNNCEVNLEGKTALDWGVDNGAITYTGGCSLNCSGGWDDGSWSCCGVAATCCCSHHGGCCDSSTSGIDP